MNIGHTHMIGQKAPERCINTLIEEHKKVSQQGPSDIRKAFIVSTNI